MKKIALLGLLAVAPVFAQQPKFDLADVHASPTAHWAAQNFGGVLHEGRYTNRDATMLNLIATAYGVKEDEVAGGPGWIAYDLFDIVAKAPAGATPATAKLMLQALLADRFGLVVHNGTHLMPRYVLTLGKGEPKLKPSDGSGEPGCKPLNLPKPGAPFDPASFRFIKYGCHNLTSAAIADNLHQIGGRFVGHEVVDSTKLKGSWDFDLEVSSPGGYDAHGISIFDAVDKQLGLKLELQNVPVPALVIDKVNRRPTDNPPAIARMLAIPPARFEVASVKLADPSRPGPPGRIGYLFWTGGSQMRAGGTLGALIALAYQIPRGAADDLVVGLPKSADTQRWDILAKVPGTGEGAPNVAGSKPQPPPFSVGLEMLRGVLLDQFELKTHMENREVTVLALTVRNGTPKMKRADDSERTGCKPDLAAPKPDANIAYMLRCTNESMGQLAENLQQMIFDFSAHPVVDATGLKGGWDFFLGWTPPRQFQGPASPNPDQPAGAPLASDPSVRRDLPIYEAVEQEIGLKIVTEKRSVPVLVVDHVDETPIQ